MTDLVSAAGEGSTLVAPPITGDPPVEWAPIEQPPKKRRLGLWIGIPAGIVLLGAAAASMILIAPGTTVAGVPVGWMTPGAAAERIAAVIAETRVTLTGDGDGNVLSGADLGAHIDASKLADQAFADRPLWNVGAWMSEPIPGSITLEPETAARALRAAVPTSFDDPVNASVKFDAATATYVTTASADGIGINVDDLNAAFVDAVSKGEKGFSFSGDATEALPTVTDTEAAATASALNAMLGTIGFYVGDERTVPIAPDVAATWLKPSVDDDGALRIIADQAAIQKSVDALPELVDRAPVNATNIVDSAGTILRAEGAGVNGRELGDTSHIAGKFAKQLSSGTDATHGIFTLTVRSTAFTTVPLYRYIDVNISTQRATLFENGTAVNTWAVSTGLPGTPTPTGNFKVFAHTKIQDMGCFEGATYCTTNVPWITWFAPDIAFHGTYWHNNFGRRMSHGCVNLPIDLAKFVYDWAPKGLEVNVHF